MAIMAQGLGIVEATFNLCQMGRMMGKQRRHWLWLCSVLGLSACAAVVSMDGERYPLTSEAFRDYLEGVFRAQNQTADALAFALEDLGKEPATLVGKLNAADAKLLAACGGVNQLALSRRDGSAMTRREALAAARSAPTCERADRDARKILQVLD